jgi:hypothetical protein
MVVNATTPALRITQTGTGNALEVEDSANPDATPFVVSAAGDVGVGTNAPGAKLEVSGGTSAGIIRLSTTNNQGSGAPAYNFGELQFFSSDAETPQVLAYVNAVADTSSTLPGSILSFGTSAAGTGTAKVVERARITSTGEFQWKPNGSTQAMTLDASGNLGVGATTVSPTGLAILSGGQGKGVLVARNATGSPTSGQSLGSYAFKGIMDGVNSNAAAEAMIEAVAAENQSGSTAATNLLFYTKPSGVGPGSSPTERARITSGGDFRVKGAGTAGSTEAFQVSGSAPADAAKLVSSGNFLIGTASELSANYKLQIVGATSGNGIYYQNTTNGGNAALFVNAAGSGVGDINVGASSTAYNTSSDYRLKNNIAPMTGALAKVAELKPVTYSWKSDGSYGEGFIAHELAEVVPQCVTGHKDAVDAEGKPVYQGIDTSFLVATLTAAIQEQQAIISDLTARLSALEAK